MFVAILMVHAMDSSSLLEVGVFTCFCFEDTCAGGPYMQLVDKLEICTF